MSENTTKNLLVVDDERDYRELLAGLLREQGYQVRTAENGADGMKALAESVPDMLLLDLNLPDTDGYALCQRIRADRQFGRLPIIMITVQSEMQQVVKGLKLGADDYILKPFDSAEVLARVTALFRQASNA